MEYKKPFAEIIESSCSKFLAQTWKHQTKPNLGSLVTTQINEIKIIGLVTNIQTGSQDPMRYPFTYKKTEEELKKEQPQIFEFLKTIFEVQIVGYKNKNKIYYSLPTNPPNIHSFIKHTEEELFDKFFENTNFLPLLFNSQITNIDEVLIAMLSNIKNLNKKFLSKFAKTFSLLSGNDYKRLKLFFKRAQIK
ncbi:hypothetical protein GF385_04500 [Candidatus Dependentiae bacterium]|nr:hypothetical protein [Candidatus Dependentiae bacterium]